MDAVAVVDIWTPELITHPFLLIAVTDHLESGLAHWDAVFSNRVSILIFEVDTSAFVKIYDGGNRVPLAELVNGHDIMGRIQKDFCNVCFFQKCLHSVIGIAKTEGVMHGCPV